MYQRIRAKVIGTLLVTLIGMLVLPWAALADDISNNLDPLVDAEAEIMPLNVGGANGTTQLYVTPRNGDGKNGCNLTSSTTLGLSVSSSNTAVATVSPSSVMFESCGDTKTLTITPVSQGTATISVSQTSNNTGGTFNLAPATFTVNVAPPANTAPSVAVVGVTGGASYSKGAVPAATCQVADAEDGNSSFPATLSAITGMYASDSIGSQTASCSYTDGGGLTASASETYSIVDPTAPVITYTLNPTMADGADGWYRSSVTLTWNVSELQSPNSLVKTGCVDQSITTDQQEQTYTCSATSAGGASGPVAVSIKRDGTAPTLSGSPTTPVNGNNGWYTSDVTIDWTCGDVTSGIAGGCPPDSTISSDGVGLTASESVSDAAGNTTTATSSPAVKIDKTNPIVGAGSQSPIANGAGWNNTDVVVTWACSDSGSGAVSATVSATVIGEGEGLSASTMCADNAGRTSPATYSGINIDKTAPNIAFVGRTAANSNGWNNTDVVVTWSCTDGLSGAAQTTVSKTVSAEGMNQSATGTCYDKAGNSVSATEPGINIDKTTPVVNLVGGPSAGSYYFGSVPAAPTCTASDSLSGLDGSCAVSGYSTIVDSHTPKATAMDKAGNSTTTTGATYTVLAWTLSGFYQPVDMGNVVNTVKGGSTVPLKFEAFAGQTELTSTSVVTGLAAKQVNCSTLATVADDIEVTTTGGTVLRYDTTAGQFIYNWQTPKQPGNCYVVTISFQDGSSLFATFKLK